jgi:hypothetical protein
MEEWRTSHEEKARGTRRAETVRDGRSGWVSWLSIGFLSRKPVPHQRAEAEAGGGSEWMAQRRTALRLRRRDGATGASSVSSAVKDEPGSSSLAAER